jgi:voltage-gated sodium channel type II alpha
VVLALILLSSAVMTLEDIWFDTRPFLVDSLYYLDRILTVVFFLETSLKLFAMGTVMYFGNAWCWLDFVIVSVSIINFCASLLGAGNIPIFKTMRTLRALRPLRAMAKMEGMKVVVNALVGALPSIFNVLLVCLIFWLIFAIIGVNLFMGTFYKCVDLETGDTFSHEIIPNRTVCEAEIGAKWANSRITFDNAGFAYLALFQIATFKGWLDIMNDSIDSVTIGQQPYREVNIYMYLYFVFFILFGSFFTLNLLVGVIIDKFNEQKNKGGSSLDAFMTEDQKKYIAAMKKASSKKPVKALPRPSWKPQAIVFSIITNKKFDMIIMAFIGLNMVSVSC